MSKNNHQPKIEILIIGGSSKIARETFKLNHEYEVTGFSKFSKVKEIKEYKLLKYKNISLIKNYIDKIKDKKIVLILMQAASSSNIIINKTSRELLDDINSNFLNFHEIIKLVLPHMLKQNWGRIIFSGSSRALKTDVGLAGYSSGKYALLGYCKTLSKEYARYGITSNYLSLGLFDTPLYLSLSKKIKKDLLNNTDTETVGDYLSILNAINFLIKSNYVTGSIIPIDGGFN
jgi:NAD(P)-dependent dehydrogenase (short-subunit alcohol dehydrogenase family)